MQTSLLRNSDLLRSVKLEESDKNASQQERTAVVSTSLQRQEQRSKTLEIQQNDIKQFEPQTNQLRSRKQKYLRAKIKHQHHSSAENLLISPSEQLKLDVIKKTILSERCASLPAVQIQKTTGKDSCENREVSLLQYRNVSPESHSPSPLLLQRSKTNSPQRNDQARISTPRAEGTQRGDLPNNQNLETSVNNTQSPLQPQSKFATQNVKSRYVSGENGTYGASALRRTLARIEHLKKEHREKSKQRSELQQVLHTFTNNQIRDNVLDIRIQLDTDEGHQKQNNKIAIVGLKQKGLLAVESKGFYTARTMPPPRDRPMLMLKNKIRLLSTNDELQIGQQQQRNNCAKFGVTAQKLHFRHRSDNTGIKTGRETLQN